MATMFTAPGRALSLERFRCLHRGTCWELDQAPSPSKQALTGSPLLPCCRQCKWQCQHWDFHWKCQWQSEHRDGQWQREWEWKHWEHKREPERQQQCRFKQREQQWCRQYWQRERQWEWQLKLWDQGKPPSSSQALVSNPAACSTHGPPGLIGLSQLYRHSHLLFRPLARHHAVALLAVKHDENRI